MKSTPWGYAQHETVIAEGITSYTTAGHGGIHVSPGLRKFMHPDVLLAAMRYGQWEGWFEEDCDWALVALTWPQHFTPDAVEAAKDTVRLNTYQARLASEVFKLGPLFTKVKGEPYDGDGPFKLSAGHAWARVTWYCAELTESWTQVVSYRLADQTPCQAGYDSLYCAPDAPVLRAEFMKKRGCEPGKLGYHSPCIFAAGP